VSHTERSNQRLAPRFRGPAASSRSQEFFGAASVAAIIAVSLVGALAPAESLVAAFTFFAVGAGAGYSLSGSV